MTQTTSKIITDMTGQEVLDACRADTPLARVRQVFSANFAEIEQASHQRAMPTPLEFRRMELQAANRILELFGLELS